MSNVEEIVFECETSTLNRSHSFHMETMGSGEYFSMRVGQIIERSHVFSADLTILERSTVSSPLKI